MPTARGRARAAPGLVLENDRIRLTVRPDLGGRIDQLVDRRSGRSWLYHPPGYAGAARDLPLGASFDDNWGGGRDEVFPNDAPGPFQGRELVDHGELWGRAWEVLESAPRRVRMRLACRTVPADVEKTVEVPREGAEARVRYFLVSRGETALPHLFKLHAAVAVDPGDRLLLPQCDIEPVTLEFSTVIGREGRTPWPTARSRSGETIRIDTVPPRQADGQEFVYASGLAEGWCGVGNPRTATALVFRFDRRELPYVWLFQSYGRWRGHHVVVVEPAATMPYDLGAALARGTCAVLPPRGRTEIAVVAGLVAFSA
jgi:hypothetical protein